MTPTNTLKELATEYLEHLSNDSKPKSFLHKDVLIRILLEVSKYNSFIAKDIKDWAEQTAMNL